MSFSQMSGTSGEGGQSSNLQLNFTRQGEFGGENNPTTNINTTLLVPAFLTSGVLLIGILAVLLWKRTAYSRAIAALEASQRIRVTGQGNERVTSRNDRDTVPRERPILWDMWLETPQRPRESDSDFWENIQPVSVQLLQNPPRSNGSNNDDLSRNANLPNLNSIARKRRGNGPMSTALHTQVSVLIAMPSKRPIHEKLAGVDLYVDGNLPEQSRKYPHDIMFGITDVTCSSAVPT